MPLFIWNYKKANGSAGKKVWVLLFTLFTAHFGVFGQPEKQKWVDSVYNQLTFEAKIGQLVMLPVDVASENSVNRTRELIQDYNIGGIVFTGGGPQRITTHITQLQQHAQVPLLIGLNAEEGLGSTLDSTLLFPSSLMLGAIQDDSLLYYLGMEIGRQLTTLGIHITFAPTADLSTIFQSENLMNHTFGDNPQRVARAATLYMKGFQQTGIIPVAKHYPHYNLSVGGYVKGKPIMKLAQHDDQSLLPLKELFAAGCPAVLSSTLHDPIFPDKRNRLKRKTKVLPEALPTLYTADYLKQTLKFQGVVFSYVPDVKTILRKNQPGDSEMYALLAGNDVLLFPENVSATIKKLRRQIKKNPQLETQLTTRVKKVLALKYDAGLHHKHKEPAVTVEQLNTIDAHVLKHTLYEKAVTIVKNDNDILPVKILENKKFASVSIGQPADNEFSRFLSNYTSVDHYALPYPGKDYTEVLEQLKGYDVVFAGVFLTAVGLEKTYPALLDSLSRITNLTVCNFGPPSKLSLFDKAPQIVQAYMDDPLMRQLVPQIIFGGLPATGKLPLKINEAITESAGFNAPSLNRLSYTLPEAAGLNSQTLEKIAVIAREAIDGKSTPGCHVLVIRKGKVVYDRSFGWYTYENQTPVTSETIYDLASVSKVMGTLQTIMFLYDRGLIDIYKKASVYLPELALTNKKDLTVKDILTHQSGLVPFIPLWDQTVSDNKFLPLYYSTEPSEKFPFHVSPNLYGSQQLKDSLWKWTFDSRLLTKPERTPHTLRYSDVGFWLMHRLAEHMLNQPMNEFLHQNLYEPMGASTVGYLPLERFDAGRIAPTEIDTIFRKSLLIGTVHDERAAMLGGLAGHAGLFGNALDVGKLGQMLLQNGSYGGQQYYKPETIQLFTAKQFDNSRRGLGWDKPVQSDWATPTSLFASARTFGHTGFTGTCIWIDPEFDLVYVFLSNRVHPVRNGKLITTNIRSRIQDAIYQSIFDHNQYQTDYSWSKSK
ncbi:MAG: serine hydrolase [Cyclobacteriaceae bacterium]|nr:serine hydrolase [Cyclobacteriaceae bacterium]